VTWSLILVAFISLHSTAITSIPGFTSKANCDAAGNAAKEGPTGMVIIRFVCVEVK
jgi:hypothetical protein